MKQSVLRQINEILERLELSDLTNIHYHLRCKYYADDVLLLRQRYNELRYTINRLYNSVQFGNYSENVRVVIKDKIKRLTKEKNDVFAKIQKAIDDRFFNNSK